ncbi:unnamed protein product, partial [Rotaria sp. Silwood1]
MTNSMQKVPTRILNAIRKENLSSDTVIYYKQDEGWVYEKGSADLVNLQQQSLDNARPLESLDPFSTQPANISIAITQETDMYTTTFDQGLSELSQYGQVSCFGQHAPLTPITLHGTACDVAHIAR